MTQTPGNEKEIVSQDSDIIERANNGKAKLWEIAEDWQKSRGLPVPEKGTPAYDLMYEAWVNHAFREAKPVAKEFNCPHDGAPCRLTARDRQVIPNYCHRAPEGWCLESGQ